MGAIALPAGADRAHGALLQNHPARQEKQRKQNRGPRRRRPRREKAWPETGSVRRADGGPATRTA